MDKNSNSGIKIESINLLSSCVKMRNSEGDLEFGLSITSITRNVVSDDELRVVVAFDLMKGIETPLFDLSASYGVCYKRSSDAPMNWNDFNNGFILTHVLPYFREFASAVTLRLPIPALIIPPTNVNVLLAEYKASEATE